MVRFSGDGSAVYYIPDGYCMLGLTAPTAYFGRRGANIAYPLPIQAAMKQGQALAQVKKYSASGVTLELHGAGATFAIEDGKPKVGGGSSFDLTLTISGANSAYSFAAGSKHTVTIKDLTTGKTAPAKELTAISSANLQVPVAGKDVEVTI